MPLHVVADGHGTDEQAARLARRLGAELGEPPQPPALVLAVTNERLELREKLDGDRGDVLSVELTTVHDSPLLRRAALVDSPGTVTIVDATAGIGQDALILAAGGARVVMIERSELVAALLEDGLRRAREGAPTGRVERLELLHGDSCALLPELAPVDVVYLDPMYPLSGREGRKAKGMRLLRQHLGDSPDEPELLKAARAAATRRVVVKRPLRAPAFAGLPPSGSLRGKTVRYDLYAPLSSREARGVPGGTDV